MASFTLQASVCLLQCSGTFGHACFPTSSDKIFATRGREPQIALHHSLKIASSAVRDENTGEEKRRKLNRRFRWPLISSASRTRFGISTTSAIRARHIVARADDCSVQVYVPEGSTRNDRRGSAVTHIYAREMSERTGASLIAS